MSNFTAVSKQTISSPRTHTHTHTHQCSLHGRYRCSPPLCGHTPLRSGRGWSSTGWSPSHSNLPWSPRGSGSAGRRWGGWVGTGWRAMRWRGRSCWSAAQRCTSCSSGRVHADTRCRQTEGPGVGTTVGDQEVGATGLEGRFRNMLRHIYTFGKKCSQNMSSDKLILNHNLSS